MTNVLMIAPYRHKNDGWGEAAKTYAQAMIRAGINLSLRPYYYIPNVCNSDELPPELLAAEQNKSDTYDSIVQMMLPQDIAYWSPKGERNIAICFMESRGLLSSPANLWLQNLELMDKVLVSSEFEAHELERHGVRAGIIRQAMDSSFYENTDKLEDLERVKDGKYYFYFIGSGVQRKNLQSLLLAFHLEFEYYEKVGLVIKGNQETQKLCESIKQNLGKTTKNKFINEVIITEQLAEQDLARIHNSCDCFVMPSAGECICRPVIDAASFGNMVIVTTGTAMEELLANKLTVESSEDVVLTAGSAPGVHTPYETWRVPNINHLRKVLRRAYEDRMKQSEQGQDMAKQEYSLETVGRMILNEINS